MRAIKGGPRPATAAPEKASCCNKSHAFDFIHSVILASDLVSLLSFTNWEDDFNLFLSTTFCGSLWLQRLSDLPCGIGIRTLNLGRDSHPQRRTDRESGRLDSVNECLQPITALGVIIGSVQNCHSVLFLSKRLFCVGTNKLLRVKCSWWWWSRSARCPSWPFVFLMKTLLEFEIFFTRKRG